jgi:serine/threonine protein kinase
MVGAQVTGKRVAIKKIKDVFRDLTDAKRILREIKLLRHLGGHQNIIWILDIMVSPNRRDFVCVARRRCGGREGGRAEWGV